jgi:DNA polymerase III alpha subunit
LNFALPLVFLYICSTFVLMPLHPKYDCHWPQPPAALPHNRLDEPAQGALVTVAGLVLVRQRPGTAKGVIFLTLEDETGVSNIIVWKKTYDAFRRAVIAGRLLRVTGRLQRDGQVVHIIAQKIEDISPMLDRLLGPVS